MVDKIEFCSTWFNGLFRNHIAKRIKRNYGIDVNIETFIFKHDDATKKVTFTIAASGETSEDNFAEIIAKALK